MKVMTNSLNKGDIKKLPKGDEIRELVCGLSARWGYVYAKHVDVCPNDRTRECACRDPWWAYCYAKDVDKVPREDTRKSAYRDNLVVYLYQRDVDKKFLDIWKTGKNKL